jgi:hypothetical protein
MRQGETQMRENAIDSENNSKPAPEAAQPKAGHKTRQEGQGRGREEGGPGQEDRRQIEGGPHEQEGRGHRDDEARQGRDAGRDHAGYKPIWMKDVLTNEDINYRMVVEIRKAQFLIADFTGLKAGVYFEAGFALGLGRNVFWTTKADGLGKIHFDTNHYQHVVWTTYSDLKLKLSEKIVALLGYGPEAAIGAAPVR